MSKIISYDCRLRFAKCMRNGCHQYVTLLVCKDKLLNGFVKFGCPHLALNMARLMAVLEKKSKTKTKHQTKHKKGSK